MNDRTAPVNSWNEWDPLEEVILGTPVGSYFAAWRTINEVTVPPGEWVAAEAALGGAGHPYPAEMIDAALRAVQELDRILVGEGVTVRHVGTANYGAPFGTPDWQVTSGFSATNPRDPFMVIGDEIIETPMADRSRYFEAWAYRPLFKEYLRAGARWTAAPKPTLQDDLYDAHYERPAEGEKARFILTEFEPVFDAADFVRCGRDIFGQLSNVTNEFGVLWLQRHLGDEFRIHLIENESSEAIHIDTTFMPLAPGKVLVNPHYVNVDRLPPILNSWDILISPDPVPFPSPLKLVSDWISINVLMLDEERVIVEEAQEPLIAQLKAWGFKPIPVDFDAYYPFLGGIHCATLDIRRRGALQSYF